ncbi:translation protein SH3-like domain-containing protein [Aspergillus carlsbadensis]|nr:translation protein SH3-like domain-containing protein [Aspergillus carlsbadensis]
MADPETELPTAPDGESQTISVDNSHLRKGAYVMIQGHPCNLVDLYTAQTGKRGKKTQLTGIDIFTGKKYQSVVVSTGKSEAPIVGREEYQLVGIDDAGQHLVLTDKDGNPKENVPVPGDDSGQAVLEYVDKGESATVTVMSAMGQGKCIAVRATS